MLDSDNLFSKSSIEMNTIWEPLSKKEQTLSLKVLKNIK